MNKGNLIDAVYGKNDLPRDTVERVITATIDEIKSELITNGEVKLVGFGTFKRYKRKETIKRNPQNGEDIIVPAKYAVSFKIARNKKWRWVE